MITSNNFSLFNGTSVTLALAGDYIGKTKVISIDESRSSDDES